MDPIADMLTRIRNAQIVGKKTASVPYSSIKGEILRVIKDAGYVDDIARRGRKNRRLLEVTLRYDAEGAGAITGLRRVSKQSKRIYWQAQDMKRPRRGIGMYVISTSRGVMTAREARAMRIGGEIICEVW